MVDVGQQAPDFTLQDTQGQEVTLSTFRGKAPVVLAFFPKAFTGTCERQVSAHAQDIEQFRALHAQVVGVSTDQVPSQQAFAKQCDAAGKVTLLSDFRHKAIQAYGVAVDEGPLPNQRAVFILDRDGVVRYKHVEPQASNFQGTGPELEALRGMGA